MFVAGARVLEPVTYDEFIGPNRREIRRAASISDHIERYFTAAAGPAFLFAAVMLLRPRHARAEGLFLL